MAVRYLFLALLALFATSCAEVSTTLQVEQGTPVKIFLSGSGSLGRLVIRGPKKFRESIGPDYSAYWYVEANVANARSVSTLSPIEYGVLPTGYQQVYPETGSAPPLTDEGIYYVEIDTYNAPGTSGFFVIRNGKFQFAKNESELPKDFP